MNAFAIRSVCLFGSASRGTKDMWSDIDVLIVADDSLSRTEMARVWSSKGASVSCFSPQRLARLAQSGSLFIQHLKDEGRILRDDFGWLKTVLSDFQMRQNYLADAYDSVALARPIDRVRFQREVGKHPIVADLAYVAVRNFGVCYSAHLGRPIFDYAVIVEFLQRKFSLSNAEVELLYSLRCHKSMFRSGQEFHSGDVVVQEIVRILNKFFWNSPIVELGNQTPLRGAAYSLIRDFEMKAMLTLGDELDEACRNDHEFEKVWSWVKAPRNYAWGIRSVNAQELEKRLIKAHLLVAKYEPTRANHVDVILVDAGD